jgi:ATP-dependent 26S proteasome regulatory subunit
LITAEQVGLLDEYFRLARFLQPSMIIVEDVDLIACAREQMNGPCEEVLLNKLLNEMDGLRQDADVIFILTTNRPDQLEPALASRPGRIDQAIEFPLPDEIGRAKLVKLYARGLDFSDELVDLIVRRTKGTSPAFIKELMRRDAQFQFEVSAGGATSAGGRRRCSGRDAVQWRDVEFEIAWRRLLDIQLLCFGRSESNMWRC